MNSKKPIVVITGASSGIGKLISIKLAKKKYQVIKKYHKKLHRKKIQNREKNENNKSINK